MIAHRSSQVVARIALLLGVVTAAGCGTTPPSDYPTQEIYVEDTTLGPGDIFEVRVYRQEEMTNSYSASAEGTISFPLIGDVAVTGKTPAQIELEIRDRLADGFLRDPQVSVLVKEYRSKKVSIFGEVRKSGTLAYADGMTIIEAIAQAGGFGGMAKENEVTVTRKTGDKMVNYTVPVADIGKGKAPNFFLRPNDRVFVPRRFM